MDEVTFLRHLDNADRDLDSYPFWRVFKKACADNPIKGIEKMTPARQAGIILWEANNQYQVLMESCDLSLKVEKH